MWQQLLTQIQQGNIKALARTISLVENEFEGHFSFLQNLPTTTTPIIGITGPPGAGKSTLVDALIGEMVSHHKRVGVLCVDPSSPFNLGALLGPYTNEPMVQPSKCLYPFACYKRQPWWTSSQNY